VTFRPVRGRAKGHRLAGVGGAGRSAGHWARPVTSARPRRSHVGYAGHPSSSPSGARPAGAVPGLVARPVPGCGRGVAGGRGAVPVARPGPVRGRVAGGRRSARLVTGPGAGTPRCGVPPRRCPCRRSPRRGRRLLPTLPGLLLPELSPLVDLGLLTCLHLDLGGSSSSRPGARIARRTCTTGRSATGERRGRDSPGGQGRGEHPGYREGRAPTHGQDTFPLEGTMPSVHFRPVRLLCDPCVAGVEIAGPADHPPTRHLPIAEEGEAHLCFRRSDTRWGIHDCGRRHRQRSPAGSRGQESSHVRDRPRRHADPG
jgi:hypothetical protein